MIDGQPAMIVSREACPVLRKGFINGYHFKRLNVSGDERYQDKPNKNRFSHCFVGETFVSTEVGQIKISDLRVGDKVITPHGLKKVLATMSSVSNEIMKLEFSNGSVLNCTLDHPFITNNGIKRADALQYGDILRGIKWQKENIPFKNLMESSIIKRGKDIIKHVLRPLELLNTCIEMFGNFIMGTSRKDIISIISTTTKVTMTSEIFLSLANQHMQHYMEENLKEQLKQKNIWTLLDRLRSSGINQKQGENGIKSMVKTLGKIEKKFLSFVRCVIIPIKVLKGRLKKAIALMYVNQDLEEHLELMTRQENVLFVEKNLDVTNMTKQEHALSLVHAEPLQIRKKVYDITIQDEHCFYANGVLVSNCHDALQYGLMKFASDRIIESKQKEKSNVDMWNPVLRIF